MLAHVVQHACTRDMEQQTPLYRPYCFPFPEADPLERGRHIVLGKHQVLFSRIYGVLFAGMALVLFFCFSASWFLLLLVPAAVSFFVIPWVFRSPHRVVRAAPGALFAPADGIVSSVEQAADSGSPGGEVLRIRISRSPLRVQISRAPCDGTITSMSEERVAGPGGSFNPFLPRKRLIFTISCSPGTKSDGAAEEDGQVTMTIREEASWLLASRIRLGDRVHCGTITGMSNFFSTIDIVIPQDACRKFHPSVTKGMRVAASLTELGRWENTDGR